MTEMDESKQSVYLLGIAKYYFSRVFYNLFNGHGFIIYYDFIYCAKESGIPNSFDLHYLSLQ